MLSIKNYTMHWNKYSNELFYFSLNVPWSHMDIRNTSKILFLEAGLPSQHDILSDNIPESAIEAMSMQVLLNNISASVVEQYFCKCY